MSVAGTNRSRFLATQSNDNAGRPAPSPTTILGIEQKQLPPAERRIGDLILTEPGRVARMTISELADASGSSPATIIRLARRIGFDGYRDFRIALATELGRAEGREAPLTGIDVSPTDDLEALVSKVATADIKAIRDTIDSLDLTSFSTAVKALSGARRSLLIGVGAAGLVARDLRDKLYRLRKDVVAATDRHAAFTGAAMLTTQDVAIGISHSGETDDVLGPIEECRDAGATTIAITNYRDSSLARLTDILVTTAVSDSALRSRGMASRAALMTLVDCMFIAVVQTNYDASLDALELTSRAVERRGIRRGGNRK